jgi:hypothetical protein
MNSIYRYITITSLLALALIVAACDGATDDGDDGEDVDTPDTSEVTEDEDATEEVVVEEDDATEDDATEETDEDGDVDEAATEEPDDESATEDAEATPDDAADADATEESDGADTESDDAEQILEQAAERAEALETAKFELDGTGSIELEQIGEVSLSEAEGQVERPDRAQLTVNVDAAIADVPVEVLGVDGDVYFTDPASGSWHEAPDDFDFNPGIMFSEDEGLPALIRAVEDAEVLGTEEVDGREAHQVYGIISQETINAGTGGVFQAEGDVDFNVWIDTETYDVLRVLAEDPTEETDSVWEMRIFEHDEPVEIDDPNGDGS